MNGLGFSPVANLRRIQDQRRREGHDAVERYLRNHGIDPRDVKPYDRNGNDKVFSGLACKHGHTGNAYNGGNLRRTLGHQCVACLSNSAQASGRARPKTAPVVAPPRPRAPTYLEIMKGAAMGA